MSTPADPIVTFAANLQTLDNEADAALTSLAAGVVALQNVITQLQNSPGTISPSDQALLDSATATAQGMLTTIQNISTAVPGTPVPVVSALKNLKR